MSKQINLLAAVVFISSFVPSRADPPAPPADNLPVARWNIEFANGVKEVCEVCKDGSASVAEPRRSSIGKAEVKAGAIVLVFQDDRVERWTPVGATDNRRALGDERQFPSGTPVLGIGEVARVKGLQMSLRLERERYRADEPIILEVVIKNIATDEAILGMSAST